MMPLTFGLDYDDTFTACPDLWTRIVGGSRRRGADGNSTKGQ